MRVLQARDSVYSKSLNEHSGSITGKPGRSRISSVSSRSSASGSLLKGPNRKSTIQSRGSVIRRVTDDDEGGASAFDTQSVRPIEDDDEDSKSFISVIRRQNHDEDDMESQVERKLDDEIFARDVQTPER